jgi:hypothetical protein
MSSFVIYIKLPGCTPDARRCDVHGPLAASAIAVDEVVDIYEAAGIRWPDLLYLDEHFLCRLREQRPNLAIEALHRAIRSINLHNVVA